MKSKKNEATTNRPKGKRVLDAPVVTTDITERIKQLKNEEAWDKNDRNAITVFKSANITVVLVALHKNAEVKPPLPVNGTTTLQVINGKISGAVQNEKVKAGKGSLVAFHSNQSIKLVAEKKSVLLLTVIENK